MKYLLALPLIIGLLACNTKSTSQESDQAKSGFSNNYAGEKVVKSEEDWKKQLNEQEFYVIREKGTERSFTGDLLEVKDTGEYTCKACDLVLFESSTKFKSGTGWPSFYKPVDDNHIARDTDHHLGYARTEVMCGRCEGHLGHVFNDGPAPTGLRYCINSVSLNFVSGDKEP